MVLVEQESEWSLIQSDDYILADLIRSYNVNYLDVVDVYTFEIIEQIKYDYGEIFALLFIFNYKQNYFIPDCKVDDDNTNIYYTRQREQNNCCTIALLNILLNLCSDKIEIGKELNELKNFTIDMNSDLKGDTINNYEFLKNAHNAYSKSEFNYYYRFIQTHSKENSNQNCHYISFVPILNNNYMYIYLLDGLLSGPLCVYKAEFKDDNVYKSNWYSEAINVINKIIENVSSADTNNQNKSKNNSYALFSIVRKKSEIISEKIDNIQLELSNAYRNGANATKKGFEHIGFLQAQTLVLRDELEEELENEADKEERGRIKKLPLVPLYLFVVRYLAKKKILEKNYNSALSKLG